MPEHTLNIKENTSSLVSTSFKEVTGIFLTIGEIQDGEFLKRNGDIIEGALGGEGSQVDSVVAGANISIDSSDPVNPIISSSGKVSTLQGGTNIIIDNTDPVNPIVNNPYLIQAGTNIYIDETDPYKPIINAKGKVATLRPGANIFIDDSDATNPKIHTTGLINDVRAGANITINNVVPSRPIISTTGKVGSIREGSNIIIDNSDPVNPKISATGKEIVAGPNIYIDNSDPIRPVISTTGVIGQIQAGANITINQSSPTAPVISTTAKVGQIQAGANISVNNTNPVKPIITGPTGAQIKASYITQPRAWTDSLYKKLNGIQSGADKTDASKVNAALSNSNYPLMVNPGAADRVFIQDVSENNSLKVGQISTLFSNLSTKVGIATGSVAPYVPLLVNGQAYFDSGGGRRLCNTNNPIGYYQGNHNNGAPSTKNFVAVFNSNHLSGYDAGGVFIGVRDENRDESALHIYNQTPVRSLNPKGNRTIFDIRSGGEILTYGPLRINADGRNSDAKLYVPTGAVVNHVLTCTNSNGAVEWRSRDIERKPGSWTKDKAGTHYFTTVRRYTKYYVTGSGKNGGNRSGSAAATVIGYLDLPIGTVLKCVVARQPHNTPNSNGFTSVLYRNSGNVEIAKSNGATELYSTNNGTFRSSYQYDSYVVKGAGGGIDTDDSGGREECDGAASYWGGAGAPGAGGGSHSKSMMGPRVADGLIRFEWL